MRRILRSVNATLALFSTMATSSAGVETVLERWALDLGHGEITSAMLRARWQPMETWISALV